MRPKIPYIVVVFFYEEGIYFSSNFCLERGLNHVLKGVGT